MQEYGGSLGGRPWKGWSVERPEDLGAFREWIQRNASRRVAVDIEGCGLDLLSGEPDYIRLVQFGTEDESWTVPVELGDAFKHAVRWALERLENLSGHNVIGFDHTGLSAALGPNYDTLCRKTTDTMILAKLLDPRGVDEGGTGAKLKILSARHIDPKAPDTQDGLSKVFHSLGVGHTDKNPVGWRLIPIGHPTYQEYAHLDVILTSRLRTVLEAEYTQRGIRADLIPYEHEVARICGHMVMTGMPLDVEYTEKLDARLAEDEEKFGKVARRYGVLSVGSPTQVAEAFFGMGESLILPGNTAPELTDAGKVKVDKAVLHYLCDLDNRGQRIGARTPNPLAVAVLKAKRSGKWRTAYAQNFLARRDVNDRIHPGINTLQARTGRMSITNPALQTLPSGDWMIRRALMAEEGHRIISTDFAAVELRVLAALADVKRMKEAIRAGRDLHGFTAELVYGPGFTKQHRKICKGVGFGTVYGGGPATIARQTGVDVDVAADAQKKYHAVYPEIRDAGDRWQDEAFYNQMTTVTVTGRHLPLDRDRTYAVTNYQVQSAARDAFCQSLIQMDEAGLTPYLRLSIHDEVLASAPERDAHEVGDAIAECMTWDLLGVPLEASPEVGGRTWGSLYMKTPDGDHYDADLRIREDPYYALHPAEASGKCG